MTLKKVELHVHLEGTISPKLARRLAEKNKITLPDALFSTDGQSYVSKDFMDFLQAYDQLSSVIKQPEDYYAVTYDYLEKNARDGGIYIEMMYSPDHAERATSIPSIEHLQAIQQAIYDAEKKHGIIGRIIVTAVRHYGQSSAEKVIQNYLKNPVPCVVGLGLGGDEANYPPRLFKKTYQIAHEAGLNCTVHAGEFADASGMVEAMVHLPIQRIGHGVMCIHDRKVMAMVKDRGLSLELCPSSNIFLGLFKNIADHPLPTFLEEGIRISISSDDPPFMKTNLANEYRLVQETFGYSDDEMNKVSLMAIEDSFADESTKSRLIRKLKNNHS